MLDERQMQRQAPVAIEAPACLSMSNGMELSESRVRHPRDGVEADEFVLGHNGVLAALEEDVEESCVAQAQRWDVGLDDGAVRSVGGLADAVFGDNAVCVFVPGYGIGHERCHLESDGAFVEVLENLA